MLQIRKKTITPKALTAGIVAFTIGVAGAGAYVDRMQSFTDYENVSFDKSNGSDAGVLGTSSERQTAADARDAAAAASGASAQTPPAMSSTSTSTPSSTTGVQPASGTAPVAAAETLEPGRGGGSGMPASGTGSETLFDAATNTIYQNTCLDSRLACALP